mgnify:CR=1 FL=1
MNINTLETPKVLQELDYESILQKNIDNFKQLVPDWSPLESDEFKLILEAFSYRELYLLSQFNELSKAFFLSTSSGSDLDNYASFYNVERLQGSKPYASYEFELSEAMAFDVTVPQGLILTDTNAIYTAKLLDDVVIVAGETKASGTVELQIEIDATETKTEIITTPLPYVSSAKALEFYDNGSNPESDEELRSRILLSLADTSTAGSIESYESYTYGADERVDDVKVISETAGTVNVYYYSKEVDALMQTRIETALNAEDTRPLTDTVVVAPVSIVNFSVIAELKILPNNETAVVVNNAKNSLSNGLKALEKIGEDITLSEINQLLKVDGVKEVVISSPATNVAINHNEVGECNEQSITYTIV